jgi:hypothetical protein
VEAPLILQFWIALLTGMVAATLIPPVRRVIPRPAEIVLWTLLVFVCVIGVLSLTNLHAQELTTSVFWGIDQVITTIFGLLTAGFAGWLRDNRFTIATWVVIGCGADVMALALIRSYRKNRAWQPRVRLAEWMELPRLAPAQQPVVVPYAIDELNRKVEAAMAVAGAALLTWLVSFSIWVRDVMLPRQARRLAHAVEAGGVESRARLETLRHTALQLQFAARAWYAAAGEPAVRDLAARAAEAAGAAGGVLGAPYEPKSNRVVDIRALLSAQSIGWYGPFWPVPAVPPEEDEEDEDESGQKGRLAS